MMILSVELLGEDNWFSQFSSIAETHVYLLSFQVTLVLIERKFASSYQPKDLMLCTPFPKRTTSHNAPQAVS